ncbi:ubiquinone biosynthesis accessory factor UbiJ [Azotobacter beijerinckii]|uniref:Ubiquinone biosynthesis accessory factor UbiJ n=1 Tax=Azotobacter beijerinckii TaxID=170623 RepID=A0A1I3YB06_9GAMM|nr:SCP2 sterol-binding domain-containing protein [Azotobacter beijerinckii]SFA79103.1 ubiquinone biosynthesis protein UbiJ [Azotobacter beijerinckii]SFK29038.1 ubiquinone biosynthesis protein UbiJ [Azotobacter beijerinckii]
MIGTALLAGAEHGLNRLLRLDGTALPRLARLAGRVLEVRCTAPELTLYLLPNADGLRLAGHWLGEADCILRAPAASLLHLAGSRRKTAILHGPEVSLEGDSATLLALAEILQDLELDWEYELSRWLGPLAAPLLAGSLQHAARWSGQSLASLRQNLADYLAEESHTLVGRHEAEARFAEVDDLRLAMDRLEARIARLAHTLESSDNA